jgi:hypothetical protein
MREKMGVHLLKTEQEIMDCIHKLEKLSLFNAKVATNALLWVLSPESNKEVWTELQVSFHVGHQGPRGLEPRMEKIIKLVGTNKKVLDCGVHTGYVKST